MGVNIFFAGPEGATSRYIGKLSFAGRYCEACGSPPEVYGVNVPELEYCMKCGETGPELALAMRTILGLRGGQGVLGGRPKIRPYHSFAWAVDPKDVKEPCEGCPHEGKEVIVAEGVRGYNIEEFRGVLDENVISERTDLIGKEF